MNSDQLKRAAGALDELASGGMTIEALPGGDFEVKGEYVVEPVTPTCTCPDYEYRNHRCKHIIAVKLEILWGNVTPQLDEESDVPPRPEVLVPDYSGVPEYLQSMDQWVCWEQQVIENKDGTKRWTKVPIDVDGGFASSTNPETWTDFEQATEFDQRTWANTDGIGFVTHDGDDIVGIDIDDCRDPETGQFTRQVAKLLSEVETYAEVSPSGTGVRIFLRGAKLESACQGPLDEGAHVEIYDTGRYLTVTGHHLEGTPTDVESDPDTLERFTAFCVDDE